MVGCATILLSARTSFCVRRFCEPTSARTRVLTCRVVAQSSAEAISADLSFLYVTFPPHQTCSDNSGRFITYPSRVAFINAPLFFTTFHNPEDRDNMQPCLLLVCLALVNLTRAGELENGEAGRMVAR